MKIKSFFISTLQYLPTSWWHFLIRRWTRLPESAHDFHLRVRLATTEQELEKCFQLAHESYVEKGLMDPHPSGLRCQAHSFLPESATIMVELNGEVIGTVTLIKESRLGLQSDGAFRKENNQLRDLGLILVEVSALAVRKDFRGDGHGISLLLMKYLYHYSQLLGGDTLVASVPPSAFWFFEALWNFEAYGEARPCPLVKGALAIPMRFSLSQKKALELIADYKSKDVSRNLPMWVFEEDERLEIPKPLPGEELNPVMTPQLLEAFFLKKTDLFDSLERREKKTIFEIYSHFFEAEDLQAFSDIFGPLTDFRKLRMVVNIPVALQMNDNYFISKVFDLSSTGAYIEFSSPDVLNLEDLVTVSFKIGTSSFRVKGRLVRKNLEPSGRHPAGFALDFGGALPGIDRELKSFLQRRRSA